MQGDVRERKSALGVPDLPFGTVVGGDYMVLRPLRRGSMGAVYVAEQLSTAVPRAVKVLRREYASDATLFKRFEREAQVCAKVPSDHITQVIAAGVDAKLQLPWISMELLEGQDLGDYVEERGPLAPGVVVSVFEQLCHALAAAHRFGIVHRDLKPANIFLSASRRVGETTMVKVLDFGIARIVAESITLLDGGPVLGTLNWMAPEQVRSEPATPASDVWALGLLAFYVLTGKHFWKSCQMPQANAAVMGEICLDAIPIASTRALELGAAGLLPAGFDEWFALTVARDPANRFVSAAAAYAALAGAIGR